MVHGPFGLLLEVSLISLWKSAISLKLAVHFDHSSAVGCWNKIYSYSLLLFNISRKPQFFSDNQMNVAMLGLDLLPKKTWNSSLKRGRYACLLAFYSPPLCGPKIIILNLFLLYPFPCYPYMVPWNCFYDYILCHICHIVCEDLSMITYKPEYTMLFISMGWRDG